MTEKKKAGAKRKKIDWDLVDKYLEAGCTGTEIAARLGIGPDTLYDRCLEVKKTNFSLYLQEKRASGDVLLKVAQMKVATKGNTSMLIWLGKNRLGQSDTDKNMAEAISKTALELIKGVDQLSGVTNVENEPE